MQECALPWTDCGDKVSLTLLHLYLPLPSSLLSPLSPFLSFLFHTQQPPLLLSPLSSSPSFLSHTQPPPPPLPPLSLPLLPVSHPATPFSSSPPSLLFPPSCLTPSHPLLLLSPLSPFSSFLFHTQPPPLPPLPSPFPSFLSHTQ